MNNVITVRLPKQDMDAIEKIATATAKDKSTIVRDLVEQGRVYFAIKEYKEGKISLGKTAETAGISISAMIDLLADLGIESNMDVEDYLEGEKNSKEIF